MRVVVYDAVGEIALDYYTQVDSVSLCPGRLEKAQVIEALQEAVFHHGRTTTRARRPYLSTACIRGGRRRVMEPSPFSNLIKSFRTAEGRGGPWEALLRFCWATIC